MLYYFKSSSVLVHDALNNKILNFLGNDTWVFNMRILTTFRNTYYVNPLTYLELCQNTFLHVSIRTFKSINQGHRTYYSFQMGISIVVLLDLFNLLGILL